tara:strand:+ start:117 stop:329 length:213 start_codon:yes stop_codon:yes gene_type:complete
MVKKNRERIDALELRLNELENPQDRNNFHHYVRPLADRLGELEKVVEEIHQRTGMNFLINEKGEVVEVEE